MNTQPPPRSAQLLKLTEETGEAAEAFIGMHGLNSRKGVCPSRADLLAELADVIITASVTMTGVTGEMPKRPGAISNSD